MPNAAVAQRYDFKLPAEPKSARVTELVYVSALPDNNIGTNDENRPQTDAEGRFSFIALEGWEYRVHAIQSGASLFHSGDLHFDLKDSQSSITLVCDLPGRFDHDPPGLRRQHR